MKILALILLASLSLALILLASLSLAPLLRGLAAKAGDASEADALG